MALLRKPPSVYGLLALGLILVIGTLIAVYDLVRQQR